MAAPSRIEFQKIKATPAPRRINQGRFTQRSCKSCLREVFSVTGLMRSRVHEKVNQKKMMATMANTAAANCQPIWRLGTPPPILLNISTSGSAAASTSKLPPKAKIKRKVARLVRSFPSDDITPSKEA